jgi:hypothetical protein
VKGKIINDNKWNAKWTVKSILPIFFIGIIIFTILVFTGGTFKYIKVEKFNGDWAPVIFAISMSVLVILIIGILDVIRNRKKHKS